MRSYSKISPQFWIGPTGKRIALLGTQAQVVAFYLLTGPHANMLGMYYLPVAYISADTHIPTEEASKTLQSLIEVGFCGYDFEAEVVWVFEMARFQIADRLKATDKQCKGVDSMYLESPKNKYLAEFFIRYGEAFHLSAMRGVSLCDASQEDHLRPYVDPPNHQASQEQDQAHDQGEGACKRAPVPSSFHDFDADPEDPANMPDDMPHVVRGKFILDQLGIPGGFQLQVQTADAVSFLAKGENITLNEATRVMLDRYRAKSEAKKFAFWLQDCDWKQSHAAGISTEHWDD